jgi:hypothetical protein
MLTVVVVVVVVVTAEKVLHVPRYHQHQSVPYSASRHPPDQCRVSVFFQTEDTYCALHRIISDCGISSGKAKGFRSGSFLVRAGRFLRCVRFILFYSDTTLLC